jgi:hypothetical protein
MNQINNTPQKLKFILKRKTVNTTPDLRTPGLGDGVKSAPPKMKRFVFKKKPTGSYDLAQIQVPSGKLVPGKPISPVPGNKEQQKLNKQLLKALEYGRVSHARQYILEGGSIAYCNFDGICTAAEKGKTKIFHMIFNEFDFTRLVDKDLIQDWHDAAQEEGHNELQEFLAPFMLRCLSNIQDENLAGFHDGELFCKDTKGSREE